MTYSDPATFEHSLRNSASFQRAAIVAGVWVTCHANTSKLASGLWGWGGANNAGAVHLSACKEPAHEPRKRRKKLHYGPSCWRKKKSLSSESS